MPKQKSSASSATKKKHARKTAAREEQLQARAAAEEQAELMMQEHEDGGPAEGDALPGQDPEPAALEQPAAAADGADVPPPADIPKNRAGRKIKDAPPPGQSRGSKEAQEAKKKKKQSKKHAKGQAPPPPRKKQYIPPPKPPRTNVDPVDIYGLGVVGASYERIPADKVVSLRLLNKKDSMSVERGLDELLAWINQVQADESDNEEALMHISEIMPVWIHHLPRLLAYASRRVRYLTASIHSILLHQGSTDLLSYTVPSFTAPTNLEREEFLSCQLCATFDPDRQVRNLSTSNWKALTELVSPENYLPEILNSLTDSILDSPAGLSAESQARRKLSDEERIAAQEEKDRMINQLTASIEAFSSLIPTCAEDNATLFTRVTWSDEFWTFLSSREMDAPQVRRAAWRTLAQILAHPKAGLLLEDSLPAISGIAPTAAFRERDHQTQNTLWEPLITLFRRHPRIWKKPLGSSDEVAESSDSESSSSEQETDSSAKNPAEPSQVSHPIAAFFDALQVGFFGNATSGYQAAPLLLHSIPDSIFPRTPSNLHSLFSSFWGAYVGAAIDASATQAFVRCLIDFVRLSLVSLAASTVAAEQLSKLWEYYLNATPPPSKYLSLSTPSTVEELEKGITAVSSKYPEAFDEFWSKLSEVAEFSVINTEGGAALATALVRLSRSSSEDLSKKAQNLLHKCTIRAAASDPKATSNFLLNALRQDGQDLLVPSDVRDVVDQYMLKSSLQDHELLTAYFLARSVSDAKGAVWLRVAELIRSELPKNGSAILLPFLEIFRTGVLSPADFVTVHLDDLIIDHAISSLSSDTLLQPALQYMLHTPQPLASSDMPGAFLTRLVNFLEGQLSAVAGDNLDTIPQAEISTALSLLSLASAEQLYGTIAHYPAFVVIFQWAELVPRIITLQPGIEDQARGIYEKLVFEKGPWSLPDLYAMTASRLGELLLEKQCYISPVVLSDVFFKLCELSAAVRYDLIMAFLPQVNEMARLVEPVYNMVPDKRLAVYDPLLFAYNGEDDQPNTFDDPSVDMYRRCAIAWLSVLSENRRLGSQMEWIIPHTVLLREISGDILETRPHGEANRSDLQALRAVSDRVAVHLCSQSMVGVADDWQSKTISCLKRPQDGDAIQTTPERILVPLLQRVLQSNSDTYSSRTFTACLTMFLHQSGANLKDKEAWLDLAKHWQGTAARVSIAIVSALRNAVAESPRLQRYQGEVASSLTSIKPENVVQEGLPQLRVLLALAYSSNSDQDLLPPNRAIFLLQGLQKWALFEGRTDDEDDDEEPLDQVGPFVLRLCSQLVSAIQDLNGSHWDFMFDLAEYFIESFSWDSPSTYSGMASACDFLEELRSRSSINKTFSGLIKSSLSRTIHLLPPIFLKATPTSDVTLNLLLNMARLLGGPDDFKSDDLPTLFSLLNQTSGSAMATVFEICSGAVRREVDQLTLNAELRRTEDSGGLSSFEIPQRLVEMLWKYSLAPPKSKAETARMLLSWLLMCNFFQDTTTTLKTAFTEQVRKSDFISAALLPTIFRETSVSDRSRGLDLSGWRVQEFQINGLDEQDSQAVSRLAAHVYYQTLRSVPSLIRSDWESIKSKQLSISIETFTSRTFSPSLIELELARVHKEEAKGTLQDDEMSIKILSNVNEVKAVYTVDEQPMEIAIRIPPNFPLSPVEVRDVKRIGVPEATWRAWLLNVQLIISTQNGSIADALSLFKTNAARHFEGVEACAICYSVVSVTDRSMPTKRCRTCKQLFHPSCLYKWFATSHGSSCPLCRSLF